MDTAPFYDKVAEAPPGQTVRWVGTDDGVRLRLAWWPEGEKGTVLVFPGRTEFIEKHGRTVGDFNERGYAVAVIDWRGQGLSDRLAPNRKLGHVLRFADYQIDTRAMMRTLRDANMPEPYYLCAHSMGGTIGLRSLHEKYPVKRTVFSAPMWGLTIDPLWRPLVKAVAAGSRSVGLGEEFAPGTDDLNYIDSHGFEDNVLTSSEESWSYMVKLIKTHPGLETGGPSIHWLHEALTETLELLAMPAPKHEMLCLMGSDEKVVHKSDVLAYVEKWPSAQMGIVTGARHEILMETPEIRKRAHDMIDAFFCG